MNIQVHNVEDIVASPSDSTSCCTDEYSEAGTSDDDDRQPSDSGILTTPNTSKRARSPTSSTSSDDNVLTLRTWQSTERIRTPAKSITYVDTARSVEEYIKADANGHLQTTDTATLTAEQRSQLVIDNNLLWDPRTYEDSPAGRGSAVPRRPASDDGTESVDSADNSTLSGVPDDDTQQSQGSTTSASDLETADNVTSEFHLSSPDHGPSSLYHNIYEHPCLYCGYAFNEYDGMGPSPQYCEDCFLGITS